MRNNQPVSKHEVVMRDDQVIVSTTDLRGRITMVNDAFIEISGYSKQELMGKPHNILRHPDMPAAAFQDLWDTIHAGRPWVGFVKNRCKNGDFYWVTANISPILENGAITGYMSVRYKPTQAQIQAAEALYVKINANEVSLAPTGLGKLLAPLKRLSITQGFVAIVFCMLLAFASLGYSVLEAQQATDTAIEGLQVVANMIKGHSSDSPAVLQALKNQQQQISQRFEQSNSYGLNAMLGIFVLFVFFFFVAMRRGVIKPAKDVVRLMNELSTGEFKGDIDIKRSGDLGDVLRALKCLQIRQGFLVNDMYVNTKRMTRIKTALDQVRANIMIADTNYEIFYMNKSTQALMKKAECEFQKVLPHFRADELMGQSMDVFHKDPSHQRRMLDHLTETYKSPDLVIAGITVNVIANPVIDHSGKRIATVIEWVDRTTEAAVENDVKNIVGAAQEGDFTQRLALQGQSGFCESDFFDGLSREINNLIHVSDQGFADLLQAFKALEQGNLTHRITNDYEGTFNESKIAANGTAEKLSEIVGQIRELSNSVQVGAREISQGNLTLSDRTQQEAAAIEQTAASMEEISSTVEQNADNARQVNQLAQAARKQAENGRDIVRQAVDAMAGINESSSQIFDIISVIDEIAFQTNLLALNAAVEAARAGNAGRGFAVVAGEVRTLAGRSAEASKEIKALINTSIGNVDAGSKLVDKSGDSLNKIVHSVRQVSDLINAITTASEEQASGIDQVKNAIAQLDNTVQQNAALVEQTAASSASLDEQAREMSKMVGVFTIGNAA